ncbi:MAG: hypothetical protein ACYC5G_05465 [Candidatus Doudnabacteria bacterium]
MSKLTIEGHSFSPRTDHVLVEMEKPERITKGGIIVPNNYTKESNFKGKIEAVSKYDQENSTTYKVGRGVIVSKQSGMPVFFDDNFGSEYKLFNKDEIKYVF